MSRLATATVPFFPRRDCLSLPVVPCAQVCDRRCDLLREALAMDGSPADMTAHIAVLRVADRPGLNRRAEATQREATQRESAHTSSGDIAFVSLLRNRSLRHPADSHSLYNGAFTKTPRPEESPHDRGGRHPRTWVAGFITASWTKLTLVADAELVSRRRLGQTQLTARMVAAAPGAAIDTSSLPAFDYAHLRAPLPKGISSGIFKSSPSSYFLMRRSFDGFVSATGMFKATFPYAETEEEEQERRYIKSLETTSPDETAGNVWISPEQALHLAEEYNVVPWVRALLDPADIVLSGGNDSSPPKRISAPPKFNLAHADLAPPAPASVSRGSRTRRSASPSKAAASKRAIASPRKRTAKISSSQQSDDGAKASVSPGFPMPTPPASAIMEAGNKEPSIVLAPVAEEPKVKITIDQDVKAGKDGSETTRTNVEVEIPVTGEPPSAEEAAQMVAEAKEMVKAAADTVAASGGPSAKKAKRKAADTVGDADKENDEAGSGRSAKKVKTEVELQKERVRKRALLGISATLAVGYAPSSPAISFHSTH